ncbi:MAG: DegV family protein, partial [Candidatus Baltobacteraceae bacterium]
MPIHIVTDSTADIDPEHALELGIGVVPLFVLFGNESLRDYIDISRRQFFDRLKSEPVL